METTRCPACNNVIEKTIDNQYQTRFIEQPLDRTEVAQLYLCPKCAKRLSNTLKTNAT